jgi:prephenate dehydratase
MTKKPARSLPIAFQGELGAYSDLAARSLFPTHTTLPCPTFEDAFAAVRDGKALRAVIPIDNSIAGRVADVHHILPRSSVHIIGEYFQPIEHCLLGVDGATKSTIREAWSHVHALAQCRAYLRTHRIKATVVDDTAGAARTLAERKDTSVAAIASPLAAQLYGLKILDRDIADQKNNTTRFIIISKEAPPKIAPGTTTITSIFFRVRNTPGALFKALGGFATTGINLIKLESYVNADFQTAEFYVEALGNPESELMQHALADLKYFSDELRILGVYPSNPYRTKKSRKQ